MEGVDLAVFGFEFTGSVVLGALVGIAVKRVAKVVAMVLGVQFALIRYLEANDVIGIETGRLTYPVWRPTESNITQTMESLLSILTIGAGFTSGFLIGFYRS